MKLKILFVTVAATALFALPALAQTSPGSRNWAGTPTNNTNAPIGADSSTNVRLNGQTREEFVAEMVAKDRAQITEIKKAIKEAETDEERDRLKGLKRQLESDIIAMQQG